jgi:hypothetical protein
MATELKKLTAAMSVIAKFFEENVKTSEDKTINRLAYTQERVLQGICFSAAQALQRTASSTQPKAQDEVRQAMKAHRGDELSEVTLNRKLDWLDRVNDQVAHLDAFLTVAQDTFLRATGKAYRLPILQAPSSGVKLTAALDRAKAMVGETAPATDYQSPDASSEGRDAA